MAMPHEPLLDYPQNKKLVNFTMILYVVLSFVVFLSAVSLFASDLLNFFPSSSKTLRNDDIGSLESSLQDSITQIQNATKLTIDINRQVSDSKEHAAVDVCLTLFDMSLDRVERSLKALGDKKTGSYYDVHSWLSGVLANYVTCLDELDHGFARSQMEPTVNKLIAGAKASLAKIVALLPNNKQVDHNLFKPLISKFPVWVTTRDRKLLEARCPKDIEPNVVVAQDGSGDYLTVVEAVASAPNNSESRYVIYVKRGIYDETIRITSRQRNIMLIGDGVDSTIITGSLNYGEDGVPTFETAPLAVSGDGFIGQDIWFRNTAGPDKGQAVALRVSADKAVLNRCKFNGYQDTLYPHSYRQFYRDCEISGTVDFIFGSSSVVLQNCTIIALRPLQGQSNMVTAQGRASLNQSSGMSIQMSRILPSEDLEPVKDSVRTYFGRPWGTYATTVIMQSYVEDHIHPAGWHRWDDSTNYTALYYGEYANTGPGACTDDRVDWPGFHVITDPADAMNFTVGQLIQGGSWLGSTGVEYIEGLVQ